MPTYAYRCTVCSNELEVKQSFTDDALTVCSECGGALRKLFSSVGVVFKGSGFYRTDSRAGSSTSSTPAAPAKEKSADSGSSSSSGTSSSSGSSSSSSAAKKPAAAAAS
ncbi:FmdB family transcriptional regulator [Georgenia yuyongxinii]|uniref:FmdB family transcriptional regulator n=1 Tax=Georgenia yuyongxinii TaxID=2589797 RepID=A0A5B8C3N8_9MICO|nr:FmdB family zinc ribbon protein [Georgenia yuyongxinii]QDC23762.1 FmdB family transcriptional regulator [Georgenia yuyongxinii]